MGRRADGQSVRHHGNRNESTERREEEMREGVLCEKERESEM